MNLDTCLCDKKIFILFLYLGTQCSSRLAECLHRVCGPRLGPRIVCHPTHPAPSSSSVVLAHSSYKAEQGKRTKLSGVMSAPKANPSPTSPSITKAAAVMEPTIMSSDMPASQRSLQGNSVKLSVPIDAQPLASTPGQTVLAQPRPLRRRDSLERREALLKGKEGSRQRRRWENGTPPSLTPLAPATRLVLILQQIGY